MAYGLPPTVTESSRISSKEAPLNLPAACAATTVPVAVAPAGIAGLPSTSTGLTRLAVKVWPGWLSLELKVSPNRTVSVAPLGTTRAARAASDFMAELPPAMPPPELPGVAGLPELAALPVSLPGGLLLQASRVTARKLARVSSRKRDFMTQPPIATMK